jgi:hypothetical protein
MGEKRMFPTKILCWQAELDIDKFKREIKKAQLTEILLSILRGCSQ